MAQESPWFKFKVNSWNTGDIQSVSYHLKGVFTDICSYYWSRHCEMTYKKCCAKFKSTNVDSLIEADVIKHKGPDNLCIEFLDEQWEDRQKTATKNSTSGAEGAKKRWNKTEAPAKRTDGEPMATAIKKDSEGMANKNENEKENEKENKKEKESEKETPPKTSTYFFRINDQIVTTKPSEWLKKEKGQALEVWQMQNKEKIVQQVFDELDKKSAGYTFNDDDHVWNSFRSVWKNYKPTAQAATGSTGYSIGAKPTPGR